MVREIPIYNKCSAFQNKKMLNVNNLYQVRQSKKYPVLPNEVLLVELPILGFKIIFFISSL